ncbi:E3 ubiquitin-protein ligase MYLIP [Calliphora vicina]|uniref:E3 ubiquitin-protein ligase MYLIP n=1 Tax=Calliphora vicina TaxID=7373 RepID=UPI00325A4753
MWCIVNLPNGTQQAVKWDPKAIGQECLEKVCKALGVICEMEYFGLEHWVPNQKESRTHQWINLRNRLSCDGGSGSGIQLMLALRVKFWVPVHCILQESVRDLFYMQAKADLLEGRLSARNWSSAAKLAAFLCQADGLRFNETSLKSDCPLKIKREQERLKHLHHQQQQQQQQQQQLQNQQQQQATTGKERKEKDYVLSFKKRRLSKQKSVENIENAQLSSQASSSNTAAGASTTVSTSNIRQAENNKSTSSTNENSTKVSDDVNSTCDNKHQETDISIEKRIAASPLRIYQEYIITPVNDEADVEMPEDFLKQIAVEHGKLSMLKMPPKAAKYWLLKEIQDLPGYGEEVFSGVTTLENSQCCDVAVGAHGIKVSTGDNERNIPFSAIAAAKSFRRTFKLEYVDDHNIRREVEIKLPKHAIAAGLYRSITERHAFYVCDKVRGVVTNQFTRDLKGTIASMFKEDTELGKRYVFDIQHTSREVHDQARRILHERGIETSTHSDGSGLGDLGRYLPHLAGSTDAEDPNVSSMACKLDLVIREKEEREAAIERCVDSRISEAMTCKICMDHAINTMFNPCCHVMACDQCAAKCDNCPNCRVKITSVVKIFLPPELRTTQSSACTSNNLDGLNISHQSNTRKVTTAA